MDTQQPRRRLRRSNPEPLSLDLVPDRAFVLHLDVRAQPPRRMLARVEHVTSGRVARVTSLRQLVTFVVDVLNTTTNRGSS